MPTKFGLHAFHVNLYLHEFFEPVLFFDPHVTMIIIISCLCIKERLSYNNAHWVLLNSLVYNSATASSIYGVTFSYYVSIHVYISRK